MKCRTNSVNFKLSIKIVPGTLRDSVKEVDSEPAPILIDKYHSLLPLKTGRRFSYQVYDLAHANTAFFVNRLANGLRAEKTIQEAHSDLPTTGIRLATNSASHNRTNRRLK